MKGKTKTRRTSMKSFIAAILGTMLFVGTAFAGQFGPPEPLADPGKVSLGLGYWLDRTKMKQDDDHLTTRSNQYYLQGTYTLLKDWEIYGRLGAADMVVHSHDTGQHFSDSANVYGTLGFKGVLYRYGNFAIGPFIEGSWCGDYAGVAKNQWDTSVGVSAQYKIRSVTLYGGPFAYWRQADSQMALNPSVSQDDMKERHNLGAFLGVRVPVVQQKVFLTAEAQMKDRPGAGASISFKF
jgi:hypothetical protein